MGDFVMRLVVAGGIAGVASIAALMMRTGRSWRRRSFEAADLEPGIHLFSAAGCASCRRARSAIERTGMSFTEHTYESEAPLLEKHGIDRVPTVAWVPAEGAVGWVAEGVPSDRMLARWVGP